MKKCPRISKRNTILVCYDLSNCENEPENLSNLFSTFYLQLVILQYNIALFLDTSKLASSVANLIQDNSGICIFIKQIPWCRACYQYQFVDNFKILQEQITGTQGAAECVIDVFIIHFAHTEYQTSPIPRYHGKILL